MPKKNTKHSKKTVRKRPGKKIVVRENSAPEDVLVHKLVKVSEETNTIKESGSIDDSKEEQVGEKTTQIEDGGVETASVEKKVVEKKSQKDTQAEVAD